MGALFNFLFLFSSYQFCRIYIEQLDTKVAITTVQVATLDIEKEREVVQMQLLMLKLKGSNNNQVS